MSDNDRTYDFRAYFEHGMTPTEYDVAYRDALNAHLPDTIIDSHVHASDEDHFDLNGMSDFVWSHMVSTYPVTTLEQSERINGLVMPDQDVRKIRFAHAFSGISHTAVNDYLIEKSPSTDRVALFGISEDARDVEYTVEEIRSGKYSALKMYYSSGKKPKYDLFEYFPHGALEAAEEMELPIILHFPRSLKQSLPELEELVDSYPKLRVVLAHIGVTWSYDEAFESVMAKVAGMPTVAVDTSGVVDTQVIESAIRHLGPDRVMYGSDEPLNLLKEFSYQNPTLGPRILTDYPYHWVNPAEREQFGHLAPDHFTYSQFQQVDGLLVAIRGLAGSLGAEDRLKQQIFHDTAKAIYGF